MESQHTTYFVIIFLCLLASAFFSSAEVAIVSMSRIRVKHLLSHDVKFADILESFQKQPGIFLSAILLGNTLVNITLASLSTIIAVSLFGENLGAVVATVSATFLVLVLGEVIPKTAAAHNAEKLALAYTIPVQLLIWILYPFVWLLSKIGAGFTRMVTDVGEAKLIIDEEEIRTAIDVGEAEGVWKEAEADMIHKAFEFPDRPVREAMQPRTEISFIEEGTSLEEFLKIYRDHPHSRFPVYHEMPDNVTGIVTVKDVLMAISKGTINPVDSIDTLVRPAYFVPETKRLGELLPEMRDHNYHIAIVVDEFGGVAGIANLEHLAAEIMGSIGDEMSSSVKEVVPIDANTYDVDGEIRIEEINDQLDLDLPEGEYDTLAGFILSHLGRIPKKGEHFRFRDLKISVTEMRDRKIERLTITREKHAQAAS
ncbi:MAG: hemolysin family protein [Dehalococcoidia bacterium]|nr:hemolysin family protein [Dehalococcoidia bacterium]MDD5495249.1 hemolysin family protein [Dehalococcoidia bacterium]